MKRTTIKIFSLLCALLMTLGAQAQSPNYDSHEIIMRFIEGTPQSVQDDIMETYNLVLLDGPTPVTEFLLCKIDPFFPNLPGNFYQNAADSINGVIVGMDNLESDVDGIGLQYRVTAPFVSTATVADVGVPHPLAECGNPGTFSIDIASNGTNYVKLGIYDTGIAGDLEGGTFQLAFPYLFDPHFDDINPGVNFTDNGNLYPEDDNGHGTHMTSCIVAETTLSAALLELRSFKTHGANSTGELYDVIQAIDQGTQEGISIVNMSFSYSADSDEQYNTSSPLRIAMEEAFNTNGTLFIAAAGNSTSNNDNSTDAAFPATFPNDNIIAVASVDCEGELSEFSSYGEQSVDLAAPGENIMGATSEGQISSYDGTSPATALVSRVAAQLAAHQSYFDYVPIKCAILDGATYSPSLNNKMVSNGYLNGLDAHLEFINDCNGGSGGSGGWAHRRNLTSEYPDKLSVNHKVNGLGIDFEVNTPRVEELKVSVFNLIGQQLREFQFQLTEGNNELNIPLLAENLYSEIYFVQLKIDDYQKTIKVIR